MMPRCGDIDEMLAAFALDAVEADERLIVLEHLAECRLHDEALAMYRDVAGLLPLSLEDMQPSPAVRSDLLAAFEAEASARTPFQIPTPAPVAAPASSPRLVPVPEPTPIRRPAATVPVERQRGGLFRMPALGYGLAAALLVVALGLGAWNLSLQGDNRDLVARSTSVQDGMSLAVYYLESDGLAVIKLEMPPLSGGRVYQAWKLVDGTPHSMGIISTGVTAMPAELADASAVAISVEPPGGSVAPTTTPVLVAEL